MKDLSNQEDWNIGFGFRFMFRFGLLQRFIIINASNNIKQHQSNNV